MQDFLNAEFLNNTWRQWSWLAGVIVFVILFKKYISRFISLLLFRIVHKTAAGELVEEFLKLILKPLEYFILLETLYFGFRAMQYPFDATQEVVRNYFYIATFGIYHFLFILNAAWLISRIGDFFVLVLRHRAHKTEDPWDDQLVVFLKEIIRILVWTIAFLSILGIVFSVNIYSIIAGAGIAGIAIAFAAQETLQNIFGSIAIFTEKPFIVGDLIEVDGISGKVIKVGFRSVRIRTTETAYMTIPNKFIVNNKLSNLTRRTSRRIMLQLALTYETTSTQLDKIITDIKKYAEAHPKKNEAVNVVVNNFGPYAIELMVELHMINEDWDQYLATKNEIMMKILEIVRAHHAEFATGTQFVK